MVNTGSLAETITSNIRDGDETGVIRVLLVDDHPMVIAGLQRVLELETGIQVVGDARSGEEAIEKAVSLSPDVIIMDLKMPGMDGITATREIKQRLPWVVILVLTLYAEDYVQQAIEAGASGYLLKDSDRDQIVRAIHDVARGLCPIAPSLTRYLITEFSKVSWSRKASILTRRQREILKLIAKGVHGKEIGRQLYISTSTVKREIRNIFDKLGVDNRAQAVSEAMKQRLI
jgi:DNA-binding NarL/FixJ family response regulator